MHEAAGMHLISTCTGNEVGSCDVLALVVGLLLSLIMHLG